MMTITKTGTTLNINGLKLAALATVATSAIAGPVFVPKAQAQAVQPVVDVCTGIALPRSAVTDVIGAVNQPIVDRIETSVNGLTTVTLVLSPFANITDLNIDLSSILADAAAGDPISLQILDTDGNLITASDDCNVAADQFSLNEEAGVAIGGNQVTGLGANGEAATAGEIDAIAIGNNASTAVGANGAVAIGTNASVTASNSVALGANSVADRPDTVSVGVGGSERQIVNVADGTQATDAANVGQVDAAIAAATANVVEYDNLAQTSVTLQGAGGTTVTNLADGVLDATSSDAVNGSQLFATNQAVAVNVTDIASVEGRVTANEDNIADIDGRVAVNEGAISDLQDLAVQYDDPTQSSVTLGGAGGVTVNNVADGTVSAGSSDAVNGGQLFATNQAIDAIDTRVTANEANIATNTTAIADLQGTIGNVQSTIVNFDGRITQNEDDIANLDGRITINEGDIATLDNRVDLAEGDIINLDSRVTTNEGDLAGLDTRVAVNEGDIATLDNRVTVNEGDIIDLDGRVTVAQNDISNLNNRVTVSEGDIVNLDSRVSTSETNINALQVQVANIPVSYTSDADGITPSATPTDTAAFVGASGNAVRVTNVADGNLAAGSSDAVNGSQLFATNQSVAQNTANIQTLNNNVSGSTVVAVQYSDADAPTVSNGGSVTNDVTFVGADASAPIRVHNVANGMLANDAVNVGQLQTGLADVISQSMSFTDMRFDEAISYTDARIADVAFDLAGLDDDASAGTAAAMAMSAIPQAIDGGSSMIGGGVGHYRGETAFGFGYSVATDDGGAVLQVRGTVNTRGQGGIAVGSGFSF